MLFLGLLLSRRTIRESLFGVAQAFFVPSILGLFGALFLYNAGVILVLQTLGVWDLVLLKDTVLWFSFVGMALGFRAATMAQDESLFSSTLKDSVKIILVVEFLVNTYTLPLVGELLLIPLLALLAMVDALAHADHEYAQVARLTTPLLAAAGLAVIGFAISKAIADFGTLWSLNSLRRLLLPPVLSVLLIPLTYTLALYMSYDMLFARLRMGLDVDGAVDRYAKRRIRAFCLISLKRTRALLREKGHDLMLIRRQEDVDSLFDGEVQS